MPITTGSFPKALWPGVKTWFGMEYNEHPVEYRDLVDVETSRKAWEEVVSQSGFQLATVKPEGKGVEYDRSSQAYITRYTHVVLGKGFVVTKEAYEDDLYDIVAKRGSRELAFAMRQTKENFVANVYNRAFNSNYTGGDGKEMCATDHPKYAGGTQSNELATAAALSEATLEQACIDIMKWTNDAGLKISAMPQSLHVPPDLVFEAERILKSPQRVGTADNDINALYSMGKFPKGIKVNHYFTSASAYFIRTNIKNGPTLFQRRPLQLSNDNEFDTENAKYKAVERYSAGWSDYMGVYGTPGA